MTGVRRLAPLALLLLPGCIVKTAADVVTAPVKVVSKGVDVATTSQSEADEKRGRALRQHEERLGKLERRRARATERCNRGDASACSEADHLTDDIEAEMDRPY